VIAVAEMSFRLRIDFQKRGRLRFLSHLELVRALERVIRRAQLPYAISQGFNAHMRHAPGPALPVGTAGLDEHFDVWLTAYLDPALVRQRLKEASVEGLEIMAVSYVDPRARGLQATHTHEVYEVILDGGLRSAAEVADALARVVAGGTLTVRRKNKVKDYDLTRLVEQVPEVHGDPETGDIVVTLRLLATEQGSIRPEALMRAALGEGRGGLSDSGGVDWAVRSVTRTRLYGDEA
jgi:radical SAM-linked protein